MKIFDSYSITSSRTNSGHVAKVLLSKPMENTIKQIYLQEKSVHNNNN